VGAKPSHTEKGITDWQRNARAFDGVMMGESFFCGQQTFHLTVIVAPPHVSSFQKVNSLPVRARELSEIPSRLKLSSPLQRFAMWWHHAM
jgi:hypothetical protein